jgi:hypothetical protein
MSEQSIDIERVVREVLAELGLSCAEGGRKAEEVASGQWLVASRSEIKNQKSEISNPPPPVPSPQSPAVATAGELVVSSRVVTMNELTGRLDSARKVVVSREAVVTPAVRDELIRRGIALVVADSANGRPAAVRLAIITTGTDFEPATLMAGLAREGLKVEHTALDCLIASADTLAAELAKSGTLGVLLTRHTSAGMCLANRLRGVRAVTGCEAPAVASAAAAVGANLLVADPQAGTFFQLKQMITEFCRFGVRPCPEVFHARLA